MGVIVICSQLYNTLKASVPGLRAVIIISLRYSGLLLLLCVCVCVCVCVISVWLRYSLSLIHI